VVAVADGVASGHVDRDDRPAGPLFRVPADCGVESPKRLAGRSSALGEGVVPACGRRRYRCVELRESTGREERRGRQRVRSRPFGVADD